MVDIAPFKALRRSQKKGLEDISKFICPPYDVISPKQRAALMRRSNKNVVQLELPGGFGDSKYISAARILKKWRINETLQQDRRPSFYLLETTYRIKDAFAPKSTMKRYGVLVGLKLEIPGKGDVLPHERTLPKAKTDRLKLLNAVKTTLSPIFGLFFDKNREWKRWISHITKARPISKGKENKFTSHRLWKVETKANQKKLQSILKRKKLFIADGHHRYEVSWAYKSKQMKRHSAVDLKEGWNFMMTYICPMEEKGLLMLPTHRLVKSKKNFNQWTQHLGRVFDIKKVGSHKALVKGLLKSKKTERVLGWVHAKGFFVLKLKRAISIDRCLPNRSKTLRSLDVVLLHDIALQESSGVQYIKDKNIIFTQDVQGMRSRAEKDPTWVGFVLRSAGVDSLARIAAAGEVMPPKTTYFYPKVPTGFTLMPLDQIL